jgi:hypothetical protein
MDYTIAHRFNCDPERFWKIFFDDQYQQEMYDEIGIKERAVLKFEEDEREIRRQVRVVPQRELPSVMKSLVKGDFGYVEHSVYHKGQNVMDVRIEPTMMKDRFTMGGTYRVVPEGDQRIRREFVGHIKVSVPLLGSQIEKLVVADVQKSYDAAARVTNRWIEKLKQGG